ncbi:Sec-independent protein translocase subunit TatA [Pseudonocardia lutea]|jgi:sec-independent protein translocase protein TatA|uniref:Sec-independent protein translocase protein TatA n=1 Tax=Pseudonocardia lutea TaxID=2172015 RepID=A0ABW1ID82_9PSEU
MGELSLWHWLIVVAVFVLLFGARKLPDAARSLGRSARILKAELRAEDAGSATPEPAEPTPADSTPAPDAPAPQPPPAEPSRPGPA